jgi:hypothetical protein
MLPAHHPHQPALRGVVLLVLLIALLDNARPASAAPRDWSAGGRVGAALEGQQHTLQSGVEFGLLLDRSSGRAVDFGLGFGCALDPGDSDKGKNKVTVFNLETHARTSTVQRRPYVELGLGYYWIDIGSADAQPSASGSQGGVGGFLAGGLEFRPGDTSDMAYGVAIAYHMIAAEVGLSGGNLEDYWALAATLRWGGSRH